MNNFYFSYMGNKRQEIKYIEELFEKIKFNIFVEPFGGTCALSRFVDEKFNTDKKLIDFYINDIGEDLCFFTNNFYKYDDEVITNCKKIVSNIKNKEDYKKYLDDNKNIDNTDIINKLTYYLFYRTAYYIHNGTYFGLRPPKYVNILKVKNKLNKFFKDNYYNCHSYIDTFNKFRDNKDALIFLDPPYVNTSCEDYQISNKNSFEEMWENIYELFENSQCSIIMIVNNNFFMRKTFEKWFYKSYDKKYSSPKTKPNIHNVFIKMFSNE